MKAITLLSLAICHVRFAMSQIEIVNPTGFVIAHLDNIQPDCTIGNLIQHALLSLEQNDIFIKPNSYFQSGTTIIEDSYHHLEIADFNISPQSIEDKPAQIVLFQPTHSYVNTMTLK